MNAQTLGPAIHARNGFITAGLRDDDLPQVIAEVNGPNRLDRIPERDANRALVAASFTAFDRAGRELGIDAAELARAVDLAALIRGAQEALAYLETQENV